MEKGKGSGGEIGCLGAGSVCVEKKVGTRKNSKTRGKLEVYILKCLTRKQTLEVSESLVRDLAVLGMGE